MNIREIHKNKKQFLPLLLLADEQENMVDRYLENGTMYVLDDCGVKAECVVTDEGGGILEIKNIAVMPEHQRKGYGRTLIDFLVSKEIWNLVRTNKSTFFIKRYRQWTIACSNLQNRIIVCIFAGKKINQCFAISHSMMLLINCNILDFKYSASLIGNDAFRFYAAVFQHIHGAALQIAVDHVLLLICQ